MRTASTSSSKASPLQVIPVYNDLIREAVGTAREVKYGGMRTRVLGREHLIAVMLQTYRPKDKERLARIFEESKADGRRLLGSPQETPGLTRSDISGVPGEKPWEKIALPKKLIEAKARRETKDLAKLAFQRKNPDPRPPPGEMAGGIRKPGKPQPKGVWRIWTLPLSYLFYHQAEFVL